MNYGSKTTGRLGAVFALACMASFQHASAQPNSILGELGNPQQVVSTVPGNGDQNPYGVAFVPEGFPGGGHLRPGDILVSNFNNRHNLQGTGTTIVRIRNGQRTRFFRGFPPLGLTTGLAVLKAGLVVVGNMPTSDGTAATVRPGSLIFLNRFGEVVGTLFNPRLINGPWDLTVNDQGNFVQIFVSNVLNGTITRINLDVSRFGFRFRDGRTISSGYGHRPDPAALEVGPTGLAYDANRDILYVAGSLENAVFAIPNAAGIIQDGGLGFRIYRDERHLHGALALLLAPNGHLIVSNSDAVNPDANQPSELVEFTVEGRFITQLSVDPAQGGAFGLALQVMNGELVFAAVDDVTSSLEIWTMPAPQ